MLCFSLRKREQRALGVEMKGLITTRHLILNARTIIAEFGVGCYLRCLKNAVLHRGQCTFLESACRLK
jgi:hypothetical protein